VIAVAKVKVKLLTSRVDGHESWVVGDELEVSAHEAKRMFDADLAVPVAAKKATRTAKASSTDVESR
jgi:hypothetical protein